MKNLRTQPARRGFTLVEIMIVVLIIGILLSIALPNFIRTRETTRAKACVGNLKQIFGSKERWAMDNNKGGADTPTMADLVAPGVYLKNTPVCQSGGNYTVGRLDQLPTCSVGTNGAGDSSDDHVIP